MCWRIAAGIVEGKGLGASAHAALVTRGFAELRPLGEALGARPETLMGLSGLGDLLLTCGSPQSRNMSLGRALGQGQTLDAVLGSRRSVAEGVYTAAAVVKVATERASTCRSARPCTPSSKASSPSMRRSRHCCRAPFKAERVGQGNVPAGDVAEGHGGADHDAGRWIGAAHDARHVVADRIEAGDRPPLRADDAGMRVGHDARKRAEFTRDHAHCVVRRRVGGAVGLGR